jgi:hypothetical protein
VPELFLRHLSWGKRLEALTNRIQLPRRRALRLRDNLGAAKALGLAIPERLLVTADAVIE